MSLNETLLPQEAQKEHENESNNNAIQAQLVTIDLEKSSALPFSQNETKEEEKHEMKREEKQKEETWYDTWNWLGNTIVSYADYWGETFADFFGMTQSRYQHLIDAYEMKLKLQHEREKDNEIMEKYAKENFMSQSPSRPQEPSHSA
ncbi:hypothetical protein RFI_25412 [Reticulomyxa filosa]|uniref:Uncharacterized protein n=1 Tax=Reticulomyxa filosa TaxID=46433 RepID=X6MFZ8_RETFI|nr:hypothetical protein RFI_25412 [Reticulomyxa filosa]|eukprot:ETO11955.1 hypothetical protein RFI_25412 [Reticulomyxa filosa]